GRTVRFRGRIDRVDSRPGGALTVIDYKTGAVSDVAPGDDPLAGGTRLQLPVYALAARESHASRGQTCAGYWFVGKRRAPDLLDVDGGLLEALGTALGAMADAIDAGQFPANPGAPEGDSPRGSNCKHCAYDAMCPPDRTHSWCRKQSDESLGAYVRLANGTSTAAAGTTDRSASCEPATAGGPP
ncbi:MAG: PD-(D/E)XK nuclease family protein, partial [Acidimicrobiales bacterium]